MMKFLDDCRRDPGKAYLLGAFLGVLAGSMAVYSAVKTQEIYDERDRLARELKSCEIEKFDLERKLHDIESCRENVETSSDEAVKAAVE